MNLKRKIENSLILIISLCLIITSVNIVYHLTADRAVATEGYIKWADFDVPYSAMNRALQADIKAKKEGNPVSWIDLLSVLGTKYGGNWKKYKAKDMDKILKKLKSGETAESLMKNSKHFAYYKEVYTTVLGGFVGAYKKEVPDKENEGQKKIEERYGLKVYSPIAEGYGYSHYDDFGNARSYGFRRKHLGNDLVGSIGTPIVAVEGGIVECLGWNQYGGWRIGIRSFDKKRYYYYAHLRKNHPYQSGLAEGKLVKAGEVIGYLGMTGYSTNENTNNMTTPHLHFGMQLIFDESQKEGNNEIWIDVYHIVKLLQQNRATVVRDDEKKEYYRKYDIFDPAYPISE